MRPENDNRPLHRTFLQLYNDELRHIRENAAEFAAAYPKIASRLALSKESRGGCDDPFVERLLEGFAYLAARVQLKLEAEFPRFTQGILETVYPDYMAPWPSAAIARFEPIWSDKSLFEGFVIPRGAKLGTLKFKDEATTCTYTTAHPLTLLPLCVPEGRAGAEYLTRGLSALNLDTSRRNTRAAIRVRLRLHDQVPEDQTVSQLKAGRIVFYLHGEDQLPSSLLESLIAHAQGVWVSPPEARDDKERVWLERGVIEHAGFSREEAMLPEGPYSFEGHRHLREHFLMPERNLFVAINGLGKALAQIQAREFDLIIPLSERNDALEGTVHGGMFQLNCSPVVNLFKRHLDRVKIDQSQSEFQIIAHRTRMLDYEVHSILEVKGFGRTETDIENFHPFYLRPAQMSRHGGFYSINRQPRALSQSEKNAKESPVPYAGSEVFISLVQEDGSRKLTDLENLGITALCTNRHLPLDLIRSLGLRDTDFIPDDHMPVKSIRCIAGPTQPRPSFAEGRHAWRAISLLSLNYLSLCESRQEGALALRELLRLYCLGDNEQIRRVDGLTSVESRLSLARCPGGGPVVFMRGMDVDITLDEELFAGTGVFPLASVLEQFLARYVSINGFTRLRLKTLQRKGKEGVYQWPARAGRIPIL